MPLRVKFPSFLVSLVFIRQKQSNEEGRITMTMRTQLKKVMLNIYWQALGVWQVILLSFVFLFLIVFLFS